MMTGVIPNIGLFALRERPSEAVIDFVWGVCAATALGLFYLLWVLPQITDFPCSRCGSRRRWLLAPQPRRRPA